MATNFSNIARVAIIFAFLALVACGGGDTEGGGNNPPPPPSGIGTAGGVVTGPNGTKVEIPAGALTAITAIAIEQTSSGAPSLPAGYSALGSMFAFTPHGTTFATPVTLTLPFDPATVPAGRTPALFKTNTQGQWEEVPSASFGATTVTAQITGFSFVQSVVQVPQPSADVGRDVKFKEIRGSARLDGAVLVDRTFLGGRVAELVDYGPAFYDAEIALSDGRTLLPDNRANGAISSSEDGTTFSIAGEAPAGNAHGLPPDDLVGSETELVQVQSFIKRSPTATLTFKMPQMVIEAHDDNAGLRSQCPRNQGDDERCLLMFGQLSIELEIVSTDPKLNLLPVYELEGDVELNGFARHWRLNAYSKASSRDSIWSEGDFDLVTEDLNGPESHARLSLREARPHDIDLSGIEVGQVFHVRLLARAIVWNLIAGPPSEAPTAVGAYLRESLTPGGPLPGGGGGSFEFSGLEPTDTPVPLPGSNQNSSGPPPVQPAPCVPGPGPSAAAGTVQFSASNYATLESSLTPVVTVTRTGGSTGAISATITTSDGSAISGTDYDAVNSSVFFADGDDAARVVAVPIIQNRIHGEADKTINLTLSQPGGCAALGTQAVTVLTVVDDDEPPPEPGFTVGGTVSGLIGTGLTLRDLNFLPITPGNGPFTFPTPTPSGFRYEVTVVTQPTNPAQVCTVTNGSGTITDANITNVAVNCITPSPSAGLDSSFGEGGKVTTGLPGGATAMALQSDGKIVSVGKLRLARHDANGIPDPSFDSDGQVNIVFNGGGLDAAQAVAIQNDGKILVAGFTRVGSSDDFAVARYESDGRPDINFGNAGITTVDFNGGGDKAWAVLIQSDGRIVLAGHANTNLPGGDNDFAAARFTSNGVLDTSFGTNGKVMTNIAGRTDLAFTAALQADDRILLAGRVADGGGDFEDFGLIRYDRNGFPDRDFGSAGIVRIDTSVNALADQAKALAVQADGKILVAGFAQASSAASLGHSAGFALARFNADGRPDQDFGTNGLVVTPFTAGNDFGEGVALQDDGKIVVVGQLSNLQNPNFGMARYDSGGTLDTSFGEEGFFTVDFFGAADAALDVAIQPDGKIVVGGFATNGTNTGLGLVRINP
jgi:uncharacterized delta-60 repeat protein